MILPADKGKTTVVLDKVNYDEKIEFMLSDASTYEKLSRDPAPALERKMNNLLLSLNKSGVIPQKLYNRLRSSAKKTPQFYGLPKIHKPGIPLEAYCVFHQFSYLPAIKTLGHYLISTCG